MKMLYIVTAYKKDSTEVIKTREVEGFSNAEFLDIRWTRQGYDVDVQMNCLKYIALRKLANANYPNRSAK
jgi:hypothetical protein